MRMKRRLVNPVLIHGSTQGRFVALINRLKRGLTERHRIEVIIKYSNTHTYRECVLYLLVRAREAAWSGEDV